MVIEMENEVSSMQNGHIVKPAEKIVDEDSSDVERKILKKLSFLQEKILEMDGRLEKIEQDVKRSGGSQPSEKFTVDDLYEEEKSPGAAPSELGIDLFSELNSDGAEDSHIRVSEFEHIMKRNGMNATRTTYLNWMKKIAATHDSIEFESGSRGGKNTPSKLVKNYDF